MDITQISAFGITIQLSWQPLATIYSDSELNYTQPFFCEKNRFYLAVDGVARYLVCMEQNCCFIEKERPDVPYSVISTWLLGTVFAYVLQYHGYLVLHGSAMKINNQAVIFSGNSGAGKSTTAAALLARGHQLLTDDVCVIKRHAYGKFVLIPGPQKLKLWEEALNKLNYTSAGLNQVINKTNKYELPISNSLTIPSEPIEISGFYELNPREDGGIEWSSITGINKLQTVVNNTYRYAMLKPLGKSQAHLQACSSLTEQIKVIKISRPKTGCSLDKLVMMIEQDLGITPLELVPQSLN